MSNLIRTICIRSIHREKSIRIEKKKNVKSRGWKAFFLFFYKQLLQFKGIKGSPTENLYTEEFENKKNYRESQGWQQPLIKSRSIINQKPFNTRTLHLEKVINSTPKNFTRG